MANAKRYEFRDGELIRIVMRVCKYDFVLMAKVILHCKEVQNYPEVSDTLVIIKEQVEFMEGQNISIAEIITRIAEAGPKNFIDL